MRKLKLFEKVYPIKAVENNFFHIYYFEGDYYFSTKDLNTNIPKRLQRHFQIPVNPIKFPNKYHSVRSEIYMYECADKWGCGF